MDTTSQSNIAALANRGAATRNQVARQVLGVSAIEVKATIPDKQIDKALRRFGMKSDNNQERFIYFFDTPRRQLMSAGIIARARRVVGNKHDSTIKFRPVVPNELPKKWSSIPGFKVEADASEKGVVRSASLTMPVEKGLIKRVTAGEKSIKSLFSRQQEGFLKAMGGDTIDFETLTVFGPLKAYRWDLIDPRCPWPLTVELWHRADGARLMETSIKTPAAQAAFAIAGFIGFLAEFGAQRDVQQETKTRWSLTQLASTDE
jgi:hypothetical protein